MKNIAIIPARSGSKGLADKNIKLLNGKPLMAYSIIEAQKSGAFTKIFVSTDSSKYAEIAEEYGADASFLRSKKNSSDSAGSWDVVREVLHQFEQDGQVFDTIMLLQPTSPLRDCHDIINAFELMGKKEANAVLGVSETEHSPLWCNTLPDNLCMDHFRNEKYAGLPRQMLPKYYRINGAVYLIKRDELEREKMFSDKCFAYVMEQEKSIDIDTELDFFVAEEIMRNRMG